MKTLDRLIEALKEMITNPTEGDFENEGYYLAKDSLYYLKEYREKQNILKGKWQVTSIKGETWGICSNCNFKQKAGELNFCPNCGADMREDIPMEHFENGGK